MHAALLVAALQVVHVNAGAGRDTAGARPDTTLPAPDSADLATAYADSATRELVRLARGRRGVIDAAVYHYTARSNQRISVGIRALRRDRLLYRRESATRIDWWRDRSSTVHVEGAREAVPVAMPGIHVPNDLEDWARDFMPDPGDERLFAAPTDDGLAWHPLVEGGEALYRYAIGDSTVIRLPDGREVRLVELRVTPRERDVRVVTGSFWIERDDHAVVQALFRPARAFDLERDLPRFDPGEEDELDEIPAAFRPIRFEVAYITVDYALWELRWWMPRLMAFHGALTMGPVTLPVSLEIRYDDYTVEADPMGLPPMPRPIRHLAGDPSSRPRPFQRPVRVTVADSAALIDSPLLVESFFAEGEALITESELRDLGDRVGGLPPAPWQVARPRVTPPWALGRGLLRYNRVEGLSAGTRVDWDLSRLRLDLTARIGAADLEPRAELGATVPARRRTWRVAGYNRLAVADPSLRPLGLGNSLTALLARRDDGTYFRAAGAELTVEPTARSAYALRVYAERQRPAAVNADGSLPGLFDGEGFRPNITADAATQVGLAARVGREWGLDPTGFRWGAWLDVTAEAGTFRFVRPGATLRAAGPLPLLGLLGALELAAGTTFADGPAPVQAAWLLGGPGTLRGFHGAALSGPDYGRARVEIASRFPAVRVALFSDAGWAGTFTGYRPADVAVAAGIGAGLLDGLLRVDLARAIRPDPGFRLELSVDAIF